MDEKTFIACDACQRKYRWKPQMAGRRFKCKCGQPIAVPPSHDPPVPDDDDGVIAFADESAASPPQPTTPPRSILASAARKSPVIEALQRREDEVQLSPMREFYAPWTFLVAGLLIHLLIWLLAAKTTLIALGGATLVTLAQGLIILPVTLVAVMFVAAKFDLAFGEIRPALFKLAALVLGPGAVGDDLFFLFMMEADFGIWVIPVGFIIIMAATGGPIALLFESNLHITALIAAILTLPRMAVLFIWEGIAPGTFFGGDSII